MASQPDLCLESQVVSLLLRISCLILTHKEVQKENFYDPREEQLIAEDGINEDGQLMETARANEQENLFKISSYNPPSHLNELEENYKIIREKEMLSRETSPKRFDNQKLSNGKIMPYAIRKNSHPNTQLSSLPPINQGKNEPPKGNFTQSLCLIAMFYRSRQLGPCEKNSSFSRSFIERGIFQGK